MFLSSWFPYPPDNGSKIRIFNLLRGLSSRYEVTLLAFHRGEDTLKYLPVLNEYCQQVEVLSWREFNPGSSKALAGFFSIYPRSIIDTYSPKMERLIQKACRDEIFDAAIVSEISMFPYLDCLGKCPVLLEDIELGAYYDAYIQDSSSLKKARWYLSWLKTTHYITCIMKKARMATTVSENEKNILTGIAPDYFPIEVIPNCIAAQEYEHIRLTPVPNRIIFTGSLTYSANLDAVEYFLKEIYPQVKQSVPEIQFLVTGSTSGSALPNQTQDPSVRFLGYVEDVRPLIAGSWISVVPLRRGGGTRLKILEAFALGTPVVSTSKGAEGLDIIPGEHLLIADTPETFARHVARLLSEPELRQRLAANARKLVLHKYDWAAVMPKFLRLVEQIGQV